MNQKSSPALPRVLVSVVMAFGLLAASAGTALAQDPVSIPPGTFVIDKSDALTAADENKLNGAIQDLMQDTGQGLFVVLVDEFTAPSDAQAWLGATADLKGLGATDSMLVVATEKRVAHLESHSDGEMSSYDSDVFTKYTKPKLAQLDWLGAGLDTARGYADAAAGSLDPAPTHSSVTPAISSESMASFGRGVLWVLGSLMLVLAVFLYFKLGAHRFIVTFLNRPSIKELRLQAGSALLTLDGSIAKMTEESAFTMATYGPGAVQVLEKDLSEARSEIANLFRIQREIEGQPDSKKSRQRRRWERLVGWTEEVQANMDSHKLQIEGLREEEANIQQELDRQRSQLTNARRTQSDREDDLERAARLYEPSALSDVLSHTDASTHSLSLWESKLLNFEQELMAGKTAPAVGLSRISRDRQEEHLKGAESLDATWKDLRSADTKLAKLVKRTSESLQRSADLQRHYAHVLQSPANTATAALATAESGLRNPQAKQPALSQAAAQFFTSLEKVEAEVAAIEKARRELPGTMVGAAQAIRSAEYYISMHRHDVGGSASSILSTARGQLQMAESNNTGRDLRSAYQLALDALANAQKAHRRASSNVSDAERRRRNAEMVAAAALSRQHSSSSSGFSSGFGSGGSGGSFGGGGFGSGGSGGNF